VKYNLEELPPTPAQWTDETFASHWFTISPTTHDQIDLYDLAERCQQTLSIMWDDFAHTLESGDPAKIVFLLEHDALNVLESITEHIDYLWHTIAHLELDATVPTDAAKVVARLASWGGSQFRKGDQIDPI